MSGQGGAVVAGVDGCRAGWVVVTSSLTASGITLVAEVVPRIDTVVRRLADGHLAAVAVDMPWGLTPRGPRACDTEARARLGPRRSSVFPTPPRPLLGSTTHAEAVAAGRALDGRGISVQAFNLLPKIAELDAAAGPELASRLVEAHPESVFATMAGAPLATSKRTAEGRAERRALVQRHLGLRAEALADRLPGAAPDDVLDAAANAWTARRWHDGTALVLGDGTVDERGIPLRIVI